MKTWFKRKFPLEYLDKLATEGAEVFAFDFTEEIKRAYAHIEKTEALLAQAEEIIHRDHSGDEWVADFRKFKGGE